VGSIPTGLNSLKLNRLPFASLGKFLSKRGTLDPQAETLSEFAVILSLRFVISSKRAIFTTCEKENASDAKASLAST
jgi:hypothetical protein